MSDVKAAAPDLEVWTECFSKSHNRIYWFNCKTAETSWTQPADMKTSVKPTSNGDESRKRNRGEHEAAASESVESKRAAASSTRSRPEERPREESKKLVQHAAPEIAIIVPYRDLHYEQKRRQHLDRFVPEMLRFMSRPGGRPFRIYIIEQSDDNRKFNRGKLLNIGYTIAASEGCKAFIFHDVDLLPSSELFDTYMRIPDDKQPIHIARVWDRYSGNKKYFGGITSFSDKTFRDMNGFPNNFWGWGGEDDELYKRATETGLTYTFPEHGSITDLEEMTLQTKLTFLKDHTDWKCMNKNEVLDEHADTWRKNGLSDLRYSVVARRDLDLHSSNSPNPCRAVKVKVDVGENCHWTDLVCRATDVQLGTSVEQLKTKYEDTLREKEIAAAATSADGGGAAANGSAVTASAITAAGATISGGSDVSSSHPR